MNEQERKTIKQRLTGWKSISRYLGRSERAIQFWEADRGLPIHRIPGGRGQTVFAYAEELDEWMGRRGDDPVADAIDSGVSMEAVVSVVASAAAATTSLTRPPGILVVPFENRCDDGASVACDALCQQLIVRMSAVQPVRVLSWTTSRSARDAFEPLQEISARLHVRYLVEGAIERDEAGLHVDIRIVDAELDQIMLADRFSVAGDLAYGVQRQIAESVALHFALIHEGALVEPICVGGVTPAGFLAYLAGARCFFEDPGRDDGRALQALDRALLIDPGFVPAQAMRALAALPCHGADPDPDLVDTSRRVATACSADTSCRVTVAFLDAALSRYGNGLQAGSSERATQTLRWIPPSIVRHGRLYDRRSPLQERADDGDHGRHIALDGLAAGGDQARSRGERLFGELLQTLVESGQRGARPSHRPLVLVTQHASPSRHPEAVRSTPVFVPSGATTARTERTR